MNNFILKNKMTHSRSSGGFTLVETLIAIAILMIAIAGPLTVAERGLSAAIYSKDELIGSYLAQDGLEFVRNIIDTNQSKIQNGTLTDANDQWITANRDLSSASSGCTRSDPCTIDTTIPNGNIEQCGSSCASSTLYLGSTGYTKSPVDNAATPFVRYFYVQPMMIQTGGTTVTQNNAANIVFIVTWTNNGAGSGGVTLEDTLFDSPLQ